MRIPSTWTFPPGRGTISAVSDDSTKFEEGAVEERPSSPALTSIPRPGDIIAGKYRVGRTLGEGGMGVVVEATHLQLRQTVALKFMLPRALGNKDAIARFEREARAAVRLKSPHVAKVLDTGTLENGAPYMVMEFLEGRTLSSLARASGIGLPIDEAVDYLLQACEGIGEAHALGVVHRDLKPANLFLTMAADGSPTVKVLDFGVSKMGALAGSVGDEDADRVTKTEGVVGSPLYMSPEQMKSSRDVDHRSDIWSLGVCLYQLLTAKVPFDAETVHQQYAMLMLAAPPKPSDVRGDIPPELDAVVVRCLQRDPEARFANVGELARALAPFAPDHALASVERVARTLAADRSGKFPSVPRSGSIPPRSPSSPSFTPRLPSVAPRASSPTPSSPRTDVTWGDTSASTSRPKDRRKWLVLGAVGTLGLVMAGVAVSRRDATPAATVASAPAPATPTRPLPTATESAVATVPPSAPPSASAAPVPSVPPKATATVRVAPPRASGDTVDLSHRK